MSSGILYAGLKRACISKVAPGQRDDVTYMFHLFRTVMDEQSHLLKVFKNSPVIACSPD